MIGGVDDISLSERIVTTAKVHDCDLCGKIIAIRERVHYASGCVFGRFYSGWQHAICWNTFLDKDNTEAPVPLRLVRIAVNDGVAPSLQCLRRV